MVPCIPRSRRHSVVSLYTVVSALTAGIICTTAAFEPETMVRANLPWFPVWLGSARRATGTSERQSTRSLDSTEARRRPHTSWDISTRTRLSSCNRGLMFWLVIGFSRSVAAYTCLLNFKRHVWHVRTQCSDKSPNSTWLVTSCHVLTRHDTLYVSSQPSSSCRARRDKRVEPVELVVSSVSSRAVRQAQHSENAWARDVGRVVPCEDVTWRAKWNLGERKHVSCIVNDRINERMNEFVTVLELNVI